MIDKHLTTYMAICVEHYRTYNMEWNNPRILFAIETCREIITDGIYSNLYIKNFSKCDGCEYKFRCFTT